MSRGDFISHTYEYVTADGSIAKNMAQYCGMIEILFTL